MPRLLALLVALCLLVPAAAPAAVPPPADGQLLTAQREREIAPGLRLATFDTYDARGWLRAHLLTADLGSRRSTPTLLGTSVTGLAPVSAHAGAAQAVAGVNGDFFNINETGAAIGPEVRAGALAKAVSSPVTVAGVGEDGIARLATLALEGTVTIGGRARQLDAFNSTIGDNRLGAYTPQWGPGRRTFFAGAGSIELLVTDGRVAEVRPQATAQPVPDGGLVLVGRGAAAQWLAQAQVGEPVDLAYAAKTNAASPFGFALGGGGVLVRDGVVLPQSDNTDKPRTAIGWRDGGRTLLLLAIDGGQAYSRGATFQEVAELLGRAGAEDAMMLDGGGSTTMVARTPGDAAVSVTNAPSDGGERLVPNGVGLVPPHGSGRLAGFDVRPGATRVFPGLTREYDAAGYDETFGPAPGDPSWQAVPGMLGRFDRDVFRAARSGSGDVVAKERGIHSRADLTVLDDLAELAFDRPSVSLQPGAEVRVRLTGEDAEGFAAPIEPDDAALEYDHDVIDVTRADGALLVRAHADADGKGTVVRARLAGSEALLGVTVGLTTAPLSGMDDAAEWSFLSAKATGALSVAAADDRPGAAPGNKALALDYDFAACCTSAAYAVHRPAPLALPAGTQRLALWVKGDGKRHWLRAMMAAGTSNVPFTFAAEVDWTGWRRVEGEIPPNFAGSAITLSRVYLVETSRDRNTAGRVLLDSLDARVGQRLDTATPLREDPYVIQQGGVGSDRWRFAVVSDTHTTAAAGRSSFSGRQTIAAFQQIAAAEPDLVLISGDGVDTNRPEDFAFYEGLIDDYLPGIPVHWVPGNHESGATSGGTLANFTQGTGRPARETFDHNGIRFITMNSHLGSFRLSDWSQLAALREQLDDAAADDAIDGVVVVDHHPPADPSGGDASKLSDPLEAGLLRRWLADFRESSGKQVALYSGHAHTAAVNRTDGVLEVNAPSVGKQPYGAADRGGFFGWQLVGVQRDPERLRSGSPDPESLEWLRAEVRPVIDGIELSAPEQLPADTEATVAATGITSEYGLRFPLRFPASVTWSGTGGVRIARDARGVDEASRVPGTVAVLELATMELHGVRAGRGRLSVASGDQAVGIDIEVTGGDGSEQPRRGWVRAGRAPEPVAALEADATAFLCSLPI